MRLDNIIVTWCLNVTLKFNISTKEKKLSLVVVIFQEDCVDLNSIWCLCVCFACFYLMRTALVHRYWIWLAYLSFDIVFFFALRITSLVDVFVCQRCHIVVVRLTFAFYSQSSQMH